MHGGLFARLVLDLRSLWDGAPLALPLNDNPAAGYATSGILLDLRTDVSESSHLGRRGAVGYG